jgi:hypothetical protein
MHRNNYQPGINFQSLIKTNMQTIMFEYLYKPEVAEPLYQLSRVVLVEPYIRKVDFQDGGAGVTYVEEHQLGFTQMHGCKCTGLNENYS